MRAKPLPKTDAAEPVDEPSGEDRTRELLRRCLEGETPAWEEFVRAYHPVLEGAVRFTFLKCVYRIPEADVENVVQDLYARLYEDGHRRLRSYEGRSPLPLWLKALAVRHTLNVIRSEKLRGRFGGESIDDLPLMAAAPEERVSAEERDAVLRLDVLIDQLRPLPRTALRMFYYDGLSYRQISAALGISVQGVGSLVSRARERLRELMGKV